MAYAALFCVAVAMVLRGIPYWLGLIVIVAALLVLDRRALLGVDWGLLVGVNIGGAGTLVRHWPA